MAIAYSGGLTCAIDVKDLETASTWYQRVLGFKVQYVIKEMGWCELETGVNNVTIGLGTSPEAAGGSSTALVFGVKDIEAAVADIQSNGVSLEGSIETIPNMVRLAKFRDPDGNLLMFYQSLSKPG